MTRIYVLITETHAAIDAIRALYQKKQKKISEYALIVVEDEDFFYPLKKQGHYFNTYLTSEFLKVKNASEVKYPFKTLLMIAPTQPTNPNYAKFCELVLTKTQGNLLLVFLFYFYFKFFFF